MKVVRCNLAGCATGEDVYTRLLAALDAPDWHGHNLDALWDSVAGGGINGLSPPYRIEAGGYEGLPMELRNLVDKIGAVFVEARRDRAVDVTFLVV